MSLTAPDDDDDDDDDEVSSTAYTPLRVSFGIVMVKSVAHSASSRSSSWKWIAPYPVLAFVQSTVL
jgi:hypothetical protein